MNEEVQYDENGFDAEGFNALGFDAEGYDRNGFDVDGHDHEGFNAEGYNAEDFHRDGHHRLTGTVFNRRGFTADGSPFDDAGYDREGYDCNGFDRDGYDTDGYDEDNEDRHGNTRCDNGVCDDDFCDRCTGGHDELLDSDACVLEETGWRNLSYKRTSPTVAFEFECISATNANEGAAALLGPFDAAYKATVNKTRTGRGAIAKQDGSLPDETGVEFVTVPMTLDEHRKVLEKAFPGGRLGKGAVSAWNKTKCGMHVHLNRKSLSNLTLGKMLCFIHDPGNTAFHVDVAGRVTSYAEFFEHRRFVSNGLPNKAYDGRKYSALNVKDETVEFRIFRPSCQLPTLLKNVAYCLAVRDFCVQSTARRKELNWQNFLIWLGKTNARREYRELDTWFRTHRSAYADFYRSVAGPAPKLTPLIPATLSA
jgi:hypothetical protein